MSKETNFLDVFLATLAYVEQGLEGERVHPHDGVWHWVLRSLQLELGDECPPAVRDLDFELTSTGVRSREIDHAASMIDFLGLTQRERMSIFICEVHSGLYHKYRKFFEMAKTLYRLRTEGRGRDQRTERDCGSPAG